MSTETRVKVTKTRRLDQRKLLHLSHKYRVEVAVLRDLQRGLVEELSLRQAQELIAAGFVVAVKNEETQDFLEPLPVDVNSVELDDESEVV